MNGDNNESMENLSQNKNFLDIINNFFSNINQIRFFLIVFFFFIIFFIVFFGILFFLLSFFPPSDYGDVRSCLHRPYLNLEKDDYLYDESLCDGFFENISNLENCSNHGVYEDFCIYIFALKDERFYLCETIKDYEIADICFDKRINSYIYPEDINDYLYSEEVFYG